MIRTFLGACALLTIAGSAATGAGLPLRERPAPATTQSVPHVQIDVEPVPALFDELLRRVAAAPEIEVRPTVVSLPGALGFWIADDIPLSNPQVIVGGREFAHLHPDGSLHASLSPALASEAVRNGWAVKHPWANRRPGWEGFVMIYTPLTMDELDVVTDLVFAGLEFVRFGEPGEEGVPAAAKASPYTAPQDPFGGCSTC